MKLSNKDSVSIPAGYQSVASARPKPIIPDHELIRCIGAGAYGEVWLARNIVGTHRAVKIVYRDTFKDDRPFEREFRGMKKFEPISRSNDGFVDVLQIGRDESLGLFYYVMELADASSSIVPGGVSDVQTDDCASNPGSAVERAATLSPEVEPETWNPDTYIPRTLAGEIQRCGRLPFEECLPMAMTLTLALAHLHRHGLIHRDLKPSNIIFVGGMPKLADIGLVTEVEDARSFVGTEGFIPPEGPNSPRADIYSLGKVLYEMSMGKDRLDFPEPFTRLGQATGSAELEELNTVILRACATDPRERYQTAEEMHVDLALLQSGKSVKSRHLLERRLGLARKVAMIVAVLAMLSTGAFLAQRLQTRDARRLQRHAQELAARLEIQNAENLFALGESSLALAHLAQLVRLDPGNRVAGERILAAMAQRHFPRLAARPMMHSNRISLVAHRSAARFSPDGERVLTVCEDHSVHLWHAGTGNEMAPPRRHLERVYSAEFSPDSKKFVTASDDRTALVVDATTGELLFPPLRHDGAVMHATFSPDGRWIATASFDGSARVFDAGSGELIAGPLVHVGPMNQVAFSPDSRRLATAMEGGRIRIWDIESAREEHRFRPNDPVRLVRFSPDGKWIAAAIYGVHATGAWRVQVWNTATGEPVGNSLPHVNRIYDLQFGPDSRRLVTSTFNNAARVWRIDTGTEEFQLQHTSMVYAAEFDSEGKRIVTASVDGKARLWDAATGAALSEPMLHQGRVIHAEFSRDGSRVLTAGWEDRSAKIWDVRPLSSEPRTLRHDHWVVSVEPNATGSEIISSTGGAVVSAALDNRRDFGGQEFLTVWDAATGTRMVSPVLAVGAEAVAAQFTQAGPIALTSVRTAADEFSPTGTLHDLRTGRAIGGELQLPKSITCARFSPDGLRIALGSKDGQVTLWDARLGAQLEPVLDHPGRLRSIRFSPDGTRLVTVSRGNLAMIWNAATGKLLAQLQHNTPVWFAQFSPKGDQVVSVSEDYVATIWGIDGSRQLELKHIAAVDYAEFSWDGKRLVTAAADRTARVWDTRTGRQLTEPLKHSQFVPIARFSPDGARIVTGCVDGTAQVWDSATGLKLGDPLRHHARVTDVCFSPDGRTVLTASLDQTVKVWPVPLVNPPVSPGLADTAESVGGLRLTVDRIPEAVSWTK